MTELPCEGERARQVKVIWTLLHKNRLGEGVAALAGGGVSEGGVYTPVGTRLASPGSSAHILGMVAAGPECGQRWGSGG